MVLSYMGDLDGFLDDLNALGVNAVFVASYELTESAFSAESSLADDKDKDAKEIDLTTLVGGLSGYKARIGQEAFCQLRASLPECVTLDLYLFEDWYDELDLLLTEATDKLHGVCPIRLTARGTQIWWIMDRPSEIRDGLVNLEGVLPSSL